MSQPSRARLQLLLIAVLFAAPVLVALALHLGGWRPSRLRNVGELVDPPRDLGAVRLTTADGDALAWKDAQWRWTVVAVAGPTCAEPCRARLVDLIKARQLLAQKAERVRLVYVGPDLDGPVREALAPFQFHRDPDAALGVAPATADGVAALVVDPNGLLVLRYPAGFDPLGLRQDLSRLLR